MSRINEIDDFLKYFAKVYTQNPSLKISDNTIYTAFRNYGLTNEEINNSDIKKYFDMWINHFKNSKNFIVYHDCRQTRFLQFHSFNRRNDDKYVKLYLNCSKENIYDAVNDIFDFIKNKKISCYSKVADMVRSDDVVLRIGTIEEANQVMKYINSNPKLVNAARPTNPFLYRNGIVGIGYDDKVSYNTVVSIIISNYLNKCRKENTLHLASFEHFKNYVQNAYNTNFRTSDGVRKFSDSYESAIWLSYIRNKEKCILNIEQVYKMLMISLDEKTNYNDVSNHIVNCQNEQNNNQMIDYYKTLYENKPILQSVNQAPQISNLTEIKQILDDFILYICETQGFGKSKQILQHYKNGEINYITRTNNFRQLFVNKVSSKIIDHIIGNDVDSYEKDLYNKKNRMTNQIDKKDLFDKYVQYNLVKYGYQNTIRMINIYLSGNRNAITGDNNFRQLFEQYITPQDIITITNNNIQYYISLFVQNVNLNEQQNSYATNDVDSNYDKAKTIVDEYIRQMSFWNVSYKKIARFLTFYAKGNVSAITSKCNFNQLFATYVSPQFLSILTKNNIQDYVKNINQNVLHSEDIKYNIK